MHEYVAAVLAKILFEDLPALRFTLPHVPAALCELIERMLQRCLPAHRQCCRSAVGSGVTHRVASWSARAGAGCPTPVIHPRSEEQLFVSLVIAQPRNEQSAPQDLIVGFSF